MSNLFVLVGGWPGSGKSTLARALAIELGLPRIAKDELKEALAPGFGAPETVEQSQRLGRVAVHAMLGAAAASPGAVLDSTWFGYARPLVEALPGTVVEVECRVPAGVAAQRYRDRMPGRAGIHLDDHRTREELWGKSFEPLAVGPLVVADTTGTVDVAELAGRIRAVAATRGC